MKTIEKDKKFIVTPAQIRAGRALLGITQQELAAKSGLGYVSISRIEKEQVTPRQSNLDAIQSALELAGIEFLPEDIKGEGVRFKEPRNKNHA